MNLHPTVIHQSSNTERDPLVAAIRKAVPDLAHQEAIMDANGVRGCSFSHMAIVKRALDEQWPAVWIMEDDCVFQPGFSLETWLADVQAAFDANFAILCGGSANGQVPYRTQVPRWVGVQAFSSCHCWVARQDAYEYILKLNPEKPIDVAIGAIPKNKAVRVPFVALQQPSFSSIQRIYEDYMPLFTQAEHRLRPFVA